MAPKNAAFCVMLRTKAGYFRSLGGERLIDTDSTTACYNCLVTQRPFGPDGMPAEPALCLRERACFKPED